MPSRPWTDPKLSPLWMVSQDPLLHQFVGYLQDARHRVLAGESVELILSRSRAAEVAHSFQRSVRKGEERLHRLAQLLCDRLYGAPHDLRSVVIGELPDGERFLLQQPLTPKQLYGLTDLDLGQRLLSRVRFEGDGELRRPRLVANAVEYLPTEDNPHQVTKIVSRIKAEEEVWAKVVDEIFDVDALVRRDKQLRRLSRWVKDVFGLKIVVGSTPLAMKVHGELVDAPLGEDERRRSRVPLQQSTERLRFLETKDYLSARTRKRSGYMAIKSVVRWWDATFEIQVQPLRNYYRERERITRESHDAHKHRREALRAELAASVPLMGFYRELLRWLFDPEPGEPPSHPGVVLRIQG